MALYLVSYDISEKDAFEYDDLYEVLNKLGAVRILYSEWLVVDGVGRSSAIYNKIAVKTQLKDRLLVQEVTKDAYHDKLLISTEALDELLKQARG